MWIYVGTEQAAPKQVWPCVPTVQFNSKQWPFMHFHTADISCRWPRYSAKQVLHYFIL